MSAGIYNLCIEQGATFTRVFTWQTGTPGCPPKNLVPVDLTNFAALLQIRSTISSTEVLYEASTALGNIVLGGVTGTITLTIPATVTADFNWTRGIYNLNLDSGGVVTRLIQGAVAVSPEVTR
jgi:hypothetical protein